jgi:hypothetical protein
VAFAASPAGAQTVAPGPYYANPSWDQTLTCTTTASCPRFIVLSNMGSAAALDRETGLIWELSPSTSVFFWTDAQAHCNRLTVGNRKGWRLPTIQELTSLVDLAAAGGSKVIPTLPSGHPFTNVPSGETWSATTGSTNSATAWLLVFYNGFGYLDNMGPFGKSNTLNVWCVRGGQGVDPQ